MATGSQCGRSFSLVQIGRNRQPVQAREKPIYCRSFIRNCKGKKTQHGNVKDDIDMETEKPQIAQFDNNNIIMFEKKNEMDPYISVKPQSEEKRDVTVLD